MIETLPSSAAVCGPAPPARKAKAKVRTAEPATEAAAHRSVDRTGSGDTPGSGIRSSPQGPDGLGCVGPNHSHGTDRWGTCFRDTCSPTEQIRGKTRANWCPIRDRITPGSGLVPDTLAQLSRGRLLPTLLASGVTLPRLVHNPGSTNLETVLHAEPMPPVTTSADAHQFPALAAVEGACTIVDESRSTADLDSGPSSADSVLMSACAPTRRISREARRTAQTLGEGPGVFATRDSPWEPQGVQTARQPPPQSRGGPGGAPKLEGGPGPTADDVADPGLQHEGRATQTGHPDLERARIVRGRCHGDGRGLGADR